MPFDASNTHLPLRVGMYRTRDGLNAEVLALRSNFEDREVAIGCTYDASGAVMNVHEWDVLTGKCWMHGGESGADLVGVAV